MIISFDTDVANAFGMGAAVLFQNLGYWCDHSRTTNTKFYDDHYWTYISNKDLCAKFPFMSGKTVRGSIQKLIDGGMIITGNYNKLSFDRTMWYALTEKGERVFYCRSMSEAEQPVNELESDEPKGQMQFPKRANENCPKGQMRIAQKGEPIPNINPNINPNSKSNGHGKRATFTPPSVDDVRAYANEKGYTSREFDPEDFVNFYTCKGWRVGKDKMVSWKHAVSTWVSRYRKEHTNAQGNVQPVKYQPTVEEIMQRAMSVPTGAKPW